MPTDRTEYHKSYYEEGRPPLPDLIQCLGCPVKFKPRHRGHTRYCTDSCGNRHRRSLLMTEPRWVSKGKRRYYLSGHPSAFGWIEYGYWGWWWSVLQKDTGLMERGGNVMSFREAKRRADEYSDSLPKPTHKGTP